MGADPARRGGWECYAPGCAAVHVVSGLARECARVAVGCGVVLDPEKR